MECVGNGNFTGLNTHCLEMRYRINYCLCLSGYDGLCRAVLVGGNDISAADLGKLLVHLVAAHGNECHLAHVGDLDIAHFLGTIRDRAKSVLKRENACRCGRRILSKAVAYCHVRLYSIFAQKTVHRYVSSHHCGLCQLGLPYGILTTLQCGLVLSGLGPDRLCQLYADHAHHYGIGLVKGFLDHTVFCRKITEHVDGLRSLSGEKQSDLGLVLLGNEWINLFQLELCERSFPLFRICLLRQYFRLVAEILRTFRDYGNAEFLLRPCH